MGEIRRGAILNYILLALQIGIPLALTPYVMDKLGAAEYGVYMLASTIMMRLYMSDLGRTTTTKFFSEYLGRGDQDGAARFLGNITLLYTAIGAGILLLGLGVYPWLGDIFQQFTAEELSTYRVLYLLTLVNAAIMFPTRSLVGVADAHQRFTVPGIIAVVAAGVNALGTVLLLGLGLRSVALILLSIGTGVVALLCNISYCFIGLRARIRFNGWSGNILKGIFVFSFWMFLNQLINMLNAGTGNYIMAITQGSTASAVYTNGLMIYGHYYMLAGVLSALFLPRVVHMVLRGASPAEQTDAMIRLGRAQLMLLGGALGVLVCFGQPFYQLWVGHIPGAQPELSLHIMLCLVIPQTFALVQALGWQITQARDALRRRVLITGFNSVLFIVVSYFVCRYAGIRAQALWAAVSIIIQLLMMNLWHYRALGLEIWRFYRETFRRALPCLAIAAAGGLLIRYLLPAETWPQLLVGVGLFILLYLPTVYYIYANPEERKLFRRQ